MADRISVTITENGPMKISNAESVRFCGEPVDAEGDLWLCRCGRTGNAPFCDGTHRKVGFDGSNAAGSLKEVHTWEGRTVKTHFNPNICTHVFYCKPLKELRKAEAAGDDAAAQRIMEVVNTCPSGALTYERTADIAEPAPPDHAAQVDIQEGGEVRLQAPFEIEDVALAERQPGDRATLCRCGLSKNKPWCDGRHKKRTDFR